MPHLNTGHSNFKHLVSVLHFVPGSDVFVLWLLSYCLCFSAFSCVCHKSNLCILFGCLLVVFIKVTLMWCSCHFGVCSVMFIICLSCRCEDLSVLWWTCGKMSIMWWTWSCPTNTVVPD